MTENIPSTEKAFIENKWFRRLIVTAIVFVGIYSSVPSLLTYLGKNLVFETPVIRADAIVVLSGDGSGRRVKLGAELYHQGYAPKLVMTGGGFYVRSFPQFMAEYATQLKVPSSDILLEEQSQSTADHVKYLEPILKENGIQSILIVTSKFHTRRSYRCFESLLNDKSIEIACVGAPDGIDYYSWWKHHEMIERIVFEWIKTVWYEVLIF